MQLPHTGIGDIVSMIPQQEPFRFVDVISYIDENRESGYYTFDKDNDFLRGHFPAYAVTPGVILIEVMAQIGLVALGIFLISQQPLNKKMLHDHVPVLARTEIDFRKQVLPGETVRVES